MTRETKIGLLVASSFLCLVCIVVASKWRRGDDPSKEPEEQTIPQVAAVKPTQNTNTPETKKAPVPKGEPPAHVVFPPLPEKGVAAPGDNKPVIVAPLPVPPPLLIPPPLNEDDRMKLELERQKKEALANAQSAPKPEAAPPPSPGAFKFPPPENGAVSLPPLAAIEPKSVPPILQAQDNDKKPIIPLDKPGLVQIPPPQPLAPLEEKKTVGPDPLKPPNGGAFGPLPPLVSPSALKPEGTLVVPKDPFPAPAPFKDKDQPPAFPALNPKDTAQKVPVIGAPTPLNKDGLPAPPLGAFPKNPNETPTFPPIADTTPKPIPRIGGTDQPSAPPITIAPGFGGIKPLPVVKDVNTDAYVCQPADTNFAILSVRLYGTEKYAEALLAYNRDHHQMIKNGAALSANPPILTAGQQVIQPPSGILERDYRPLIRASSPNAMPTIPGAPLVKLATPAPLNPGGATISNPPAAGQLRSYKVQNPSGESILDIAERMLGNRSLWTEIYRINQTNPAVRPPAPIPAGTDLNLPAT